MAAKFESGLEPAPQDFPEVTPAQHGYGYQQPYDQHQQQSYYQPHYDPAATTPKPEAAPPSTYGGQTVSSPLSSHVQPTTAQTEPTAAAGRTICGCSLLVFILSCIVALLSAAVIGLAAATGVEAQRANSAASSLAALTANISATATGTAASSTAVAAIDDGCSTDAASVNKTLYTTFSLLGALKFTRYCNRDAPHAPILSLFTANFATCMDACAAYTKYVPGSFGNSNNATCEAVSFIPAWTTKGIAEAGGAPGNCYLKAGPQNESLLTTPNIGVACHAAVLAPGV